MTHLTTDDSQSSTVSHTTSPELSAFELSAFELSAFELSAFELSAFAQKLTTLKDATLRIVSARHAARAMFAERQGLWGKLRLELAKLDAADREIARRQGSEAHNG